MLNIIWCSFFLIAFLAAGYQSLCGDVAIWTTLVNDLTTAAQNAFMLCLQLTGMLAFWLGLLKIAEKSGLTDLLAKALSPLFKRIFPEIPPHHPALGSIVMNIAANMLGLDNAATPMGLKAMEQMQQLNPKKDMASNAQIMFMVINASAVTVLPISILMYRAQFGAINPAAVFIPILLATSASTLAGFLATAFVQKLKVFDKVVLLYLLSFVLVIGGIVLYFYHLPAETRLQAAGGCGNFVLCALIFLFFIAGIRRSLNLYETFIEGAKEGFEIAVRLIPYLVAMLTAIAALNASGVLHMILGAVSSALESFQMNADFVPALPTALMKPLSGSGARAMMIDAMQTYGADSFEAFTAAVIQGSTETTFYVLAVYFGAVKIVKTRSALPLALFADVVGIVCAICLSYLFY